MPAIRHRKVEIDGLNIFVREAGDPDEADSISEHMSELMTKVFAGARP